MDPKGPAPEKTASDQENIFGGTQDQNNNATVFLYGINGQFVEQCTGTLISINGSYGYILTAHHCEGMQYIKFGTFANDPDTLNNPDFTVGADFPHPNYGGQAGDAHDLRILRFSGANAATMTVVPPATNPDGMSAGATVDISGYGLTQSGDATSRMHVTMPLSQVSSSFLMVNQQGGKGSCSGDSGGPWYANVNGVKSVVAVTSYGDQNCTQYGAGGRVQLDLSWIQGVIGGTVMETCDSCFDSAVAQGGACSGEVDTCFNDQACGALVDCLNACGANPSQSCVDNCANQNPNGIDKYNAIFDCAICNTCANLCDTSTCGGNPTTTSNAATTTTTGSGDAVTSGVGGAPPGTGGAGGAGATTGDPADDGKGTKTITTCVACTVGSTTSEDSIVAAMAGVLGLGLVVARRRRRA